MSRLMSRLLLIAATLSLATSALAGTVKPSEGWVVVDTAQSYESLIQRVDAAIAAEKMGVVTSASASDGAKAAGFVIAGNRVVGVFRNDFARRMLAASVAAGIEAPIRLYITQNEDGTATLSYKKPSFVFAPYFAEGGSSLRAIAVELDAIFARIASAVTR